MNNIVDLAYQLKERILYAIGLCVQLRFNQIYCP